MHINSTTGRQKEACMYEAAQARVRVTTSTVHPRDSLQAGMRNAKHVDELGDATTVTVTGTAVTTASPCLRLCFLSFVCDLT